MKKLSKTGHEALFKNLRRVIAFIIIAASSIHLHQYNNCSTQVNGRIAYKEDMRFLFFDDDDEKEDEEWHDDDDDDDDEDYSVKNFVSIGKLAMNI